MVTYSVGNTLSPSQISIFLDSTISVAITSHTNGQIINSNTPVFSGTADPNSNVELVIDGLSEETVITADSGIWSIPSPLLSEGPHFISVTATDSLGNEDTITISIIVDTTTFVTIDPSLDGITTSDKTPNIFGTAESPSVVEIFVDGVFIENKNVDNGEWETVTPDLADGPHIINAIVTDILGNTATSDSITITIDTTKPSVVLSSVPGTHTNLNPIPFTATFSEPVFDLTEDDIETFGDASIVSGTLFTIDNIEYTFDVIPDNEAPFKDGLVMIQIKKDKAMDAVGHKNTASND